MTLSRCTETREAFHALVKLEQKLTLPEVIKRTSPIVNEVRGGKENKVNVIAQIIRVVEFFLEVTGKEMRDFQIQILAGDLYDKFKTDTLEDIILMFRMARQGEFGKLYKLDNIEIMHWANAYLSKKSETREKLISKRKNKGKDPKTEGGKYFHELPISLQEKFKNIGKADTAAVPFLPPRVTELLSEEKYRRAIKKSI